MTEWTFKDEKLNEIETEYDIFRIYKRTYPNKTKKYIVKSVFGQIYTQSISYNGLIEKMKNHECLKDLDYGKLN
jgi:hypothetical protein